MRKILYLILVSTFAFLTACGPSEQEKAQNLLYQAQTAYDNHLYQRSQTLIDSLRSAYPHELQLRRKALYLSRRVMEGEMLDSLALADSTMVEIQARCVALKQSGLSETDTAYVAADRALRRATINRERLSRLVEIARSQAAKTFVE